MEMYHLTILEACGLKSRCPQRWEGAPVPDLSLGLVPGWFSFVPLYCLSSRHMVSVSRSHPPHTLFFEDTGHIGLELTLVTLV